MRLSHPILALVGPTAIGKSAVALDLAASVGGVIVSADSMQVYRGMDVGTAKPSPEERSRVPHFLIDVAEPTENFSVADYIRLAEPVLEENLAAPRPVIISGGTGYYVRALVDGICDSPPADPAFRRRMQEEARRMGAETLHARLAAADPAAAEAIHPRNLRRTIRALEVLHLSGKTITELRAVQPPPKWSRHTLFVGLRRPWKDLDRRIGERVRRMLGAGLISEVRSLLDRGCTPGHTALQAIGYKELVEFLGGEGSVEEVEERITRATRRYARRQMTWWRPDGRVRWLLLEEGAPEIEAARRVLSLWQGT